MLQVAVSSGVSIFRGFDMETAAAACEFRSSKKVSAWTYPTSRVRNLVWMRAKRSRWVGTTGSESEHAATDHSSCRRMLLTTAADGTPTTGYFYFYFWMPHATGPWFAFELTVRFLSPALPSRRFFRAPVNIIDVSRLSLACPSNWTSSLPRDSEGHVNVSVSRVCPSASSAVMRLLQTVCRHSPGLKIAHPHVQVTMLLYVYSCSSFFCPCH